MVETETEADMCLRTAKASQRDPLFFYFDEKQNKDNILVMNYLNSLPEVASLFYICQIYLPEESLVKKFAIKPNSLFTLLEAENKGAVNGEMRKM